MDVTAGTSPVFRAPWPEWKLTELGDRPTPTNPGRLTLRIGYCLPVEGISVAEGIEDFSRRKHEGDPVVSSIGKMKSSLVPVVLVDGRAVATGWGSLDLRLSPGRHLVEVQSQHSRTWRAVEIRAGKTTRIDYVGMLGDQHITYATNQVRGAFAHAHGHTIGPRGRLDYWQFLPVNARRRRAGSLTMWGLLIGLLGFYTVISQDWMADPIRIGLGAMLLSWPVIGFVILQLRTAWSSLRYNRLEAEDPLDSAHLGSHGSTRVSILDQKGPAPEPEAGEAALLIDARFIKADLGKLELAIQLPSGQGVINRKQRRRLHYLGEIVPVRHRFAVPPPEILLDGRPLAATWTRMWLQLSPGRHTLEVRTPQAPMPVPSGESSVDVQTIEFSASAGSTSGIDLTVLVKAVPDPTEPLLHEWSTSVARLCGGPTEELRGPAPRLDIVGAIKHSWSSNTVRDRTGADWNQPGVPGSRLK